MFWFLLAHIGLPTLFGLVFMIFSVLPTRGPLSWDIGLEVGLDMAVLSIGAIGALFANPILVGRYGGAHAVLLALAVLGINFILSGILFGIKWFALNANVTIGWKLGSAAIYIGALTLIVVGGVVAWTYLHPGQSQGPVEKVAEYGRSCPVCWLGFA